MTNLDLNNFPTVENMIPMLNFNHLHEFRSLYDNSDISQRIYGCSNFLHFKSDENYPLYLEGASIRAALNEFVSLNEMIKVSPNLNIRMKSIENLDIPLLHFFKLLREVNFHLNSIGHGKTKVSVRNIDTESGKIADKIFSFHFTIIENLEIGIFRNLFNFKKYDSAQIEVVVLWIKENQYTWGINHLLDLALRQYCVEIENVISY
jgi:hypothetical protein